MQRLLALGDQRISGDGVVVIKAQDHRSLERNKASVKSVKCSVMGVITLDGISAISAGALSVGGSVGGSASIVAQLGASAGFSL